jgi:hypothetical protein
MRPPGLILPTKGLYVRVDESNLYLRYNPTTDGAKPIASCTRVGFAKNVVPERSLSLPTGNRMRADEKAFCSGLFQHPQALALN